jgi:hypothetical protein
MALLGCDDGGFSGCTGSTPGPEGRPGDLGRGVFLYRCVLESDPMCDADAADLALDTRVAVGARLGLYYEANDGAGSRSVESASETLLEPMQTDTFRAREPGEVAVLVLGDDGRLFDLTHVGLDLVESVALDVKGGIFDIDPSSVQVLVDQTLEVRATPRDAADTILAGALLCDWESADPDIVAIETPPDDNVVTVRALAPGVTTLTVQLGSVPASLDITVDEVGAGGAGGQGGAP